MFAKKKATVFSSAPDTYVMLRAWYGVVSTGNQAGYALDKLAEPDREDFPNARFSLVRDRYVDDIFSGSETKLGRDQQIKEVTELLNNAGFKLKFVVKSGEAPDEKASPDGKSTKILGYRYEPYPGVSELNVNKKRRVMKIPNPEPVVTPEDADKILQKVKLTRRIIISKISKINDPVGIWEPLKLQLKLKLLSAGIGSRPWDEKLTADEQVSCSLVLLFSDSLIFWFSGSLVLWFSGSLVFYYKCIRKE